ncbi:MAG: hypothetical protein AAF497_04925 [Planctomycetota bacterium]
MRRSFLLLLFVVSSSLHLSDSAFARVAVSFDVSSVVACREVVDEAFQRDHPDLRLVQLEVEISALVRGDAENLVETVYSLDAPERRVAVHDFLPRTSLVTDVVGNIEVQRSLDKGVDAQLSVSGDLGKFAGGNASLGGNRSRADSYRYQQLPPREMLSAAGTVARGAGVYFKLKPTAQSSLEGARKFIITLRVPQSWRADYLRANCHATTRDGRRIGGSSYIVPLFMAGDATARELAHRLSEDERRLLSAAHAHRSVIRRVSHPTMAHELTLRQPDIPADWLSRILTTLALHEAAAYERRLPIPIQAEVARYRNSKLAMKLLVRRNVDQATYATQVEDGDSQPKSVQVRLRPIQAIRHDVPAENQPPVFSGAGWKSRT